MIEAPETTDLDRFLSGEIDTATFNHREHVRMAFELLRLYPFSEALYRFAHALRKTVARAGWPHAYHETITVAFLALVGEHMAVRPADDFAAFAAANPELFEKSILRRWYDAARLDSPLARVTFLLPLPCRAP